MRSNNQKAVTLWLVVPCYNEEPMLPLSMPRLEKLMEEMQSEGLVTDSSRIVYVDDCSRDKTWDIISSAHAEKPVHCGLRFGRNSGQENALLAGLEASVGMADAVVTIDADLQDDIRVIPDMVRRYREGYEIVYGVRNDRHQDTFFKRATAVGFYRVMRWLGSPTVYNHANFQLLGSRAVAELMRYGERDLFLRGLVPLLGFPSTSVAYERQGREAGVTKWTVGKMMALAVNGITAVSVKPVHLLFVFGLLFIVVALAVAAWVLWNMVAGRSVSGWASLMLSVWFIGGCIMMGLGIIGEYIAKVVVDVKQRPRYNVIENLFPAS